ncbi:MAG: glycosyltransferase, partial [Eubacteriales bacterium]|nr:glycosyltransferase [Eubacteriales bacterium]
MKGNHTDGKEFVNTNKEIDDLNTQLNHAYTTIDKLIRRVAELEGGNMYKLKKILRKYWRRLRLNFSKGDDRNRFSLLFHYVFRRGGKVLRFILAKGLKQLYLLTEPRKVVIIEVAGNYLATTSGYSQHLIRRQITAGRERFYRDQIAGFRHKPLFSVIIPVYNPPLDFFRQALDSVVNQLYDGWEICMADDCSTQPGVREILEEYASKYANIKVVYRTENGHISRASNSALELATGEYAVLIDQDDLLRRDAFYFLLKALNLRPDID